MSGYIKIPDNDWDYERKHCSCDKREIIIIDKDRDFKNKKKCGCAPCKPQRPKQRGLVLACGKQNMDISFDLDSLPTFPVEIASAAVDTTCLCSPLVLLNFCTTIAVPEIPADAVEEGSVEYTIRLSKECENIPKYTLAEFTFSRQGLSGASTPASTNPFCFKFCDFNNSCTGCCFYTVEIENVEVGGNTQLIGTTTISNGVITAKAQGVCDDK